MTTRFIEQAIARAGLLPLLEARRRGDLDAVRGFIQALAAADLLVVGAVADLVRAEEIGEEVRIHVTAPSTATVAMSTGDGADVAWVTSSDELGLLRAVAVARVTGGKGARVGVDWGRSGLELAQVALGFGASDLAGTIAKKSGLIVLETEARKVKGQGMVALSALKRREIEGLVRNAGRVAVFVDLPHAIESSPRVEDAHA